MESCNEMGLAALIAISQADEERWKRFAESLDIILAWIALICLAIAPFLLYYYGRRLV